LSDTTSPADSSPSPLWPPFAWPLVLLCALLVLVTGMIANANVVGPDIFKRTSPRNTELAIWGLNLALFVLVGVSLAVIRRNYRPWLPKLSLSLTATWFALALFGYAAEVHLKFRRPESGEQQARRQTALAQVAHEGRFIRLRELPPNQDLVMRPSASALEKADNLDDRQVRVRTDAGGFLLPVSGGIKPEVKIVFLGGSTTECYWVQETQRFVHRVGVQLSEQSRQPVATYNAGVSGNHSMHSINSLINKMLPLHPDYAVLMHAINDLVVLLYTGTYWNDHPSRSLVGSLQTAHAGQPEGPSFIVFPRAARWLRQVLSQPSLGPRLRFEWSGYQGKKISVDERAVIGSFRRSIRLFVAVCNSQGVQPVLMTQASRLSENPDDFTRAIIGGRWEQNGVSYEQFQGIYAELNEVVREVGRDTETEVIDLARIVPVELEYFYDPVHLNEHGCELAADAITKQLLPLIRQAQGSPAAAD